MIMKSSACYSEVALRKFWRTLPQDIVIEHIMPYTYRKQSPEILYDIHNFYQDYALVDEYYSHNYNHYMWLNDIVSFFTLPHFQGSKKKGVDKILQRHLYYKNIGRDIDRKVRFLWGLLLQIERTRFINKFLLEYEV